MTEPASSRSPRAQGGLRILQYQLSAIATCRAVALAATRAREPVHEVNDGTLARLQSIGRTCEAACSRAS